MSLTTLPKLENRESLRVRSVCVGDRIDVRTLLENSDRIATNPIMVSAGEYGCAVLTRYGVVVFFEVTPIEQASFLQYLNPFITRPFARTEDEIVELRLCPDRDDHVENGIIHLKNFSVERLQIVADILTKSVVMAYYEIGISKAFDRVEPLAENLHRSGRTGLQGRELLKQVGEILLIQHRMVGRVEVADKPDLLWENNELERLYERLHSEYELQERHDRLDHKLALVQSTAQTLIELLHSDRSHRVEWYITILIVFEIMISLYEMFVAKLIFAH